MFSHTKSRTFTQVYSKKFIFHQLCTIYFIATGFKAPGGICDGNIQRRPASNWNCKQHLDVILKYGIV